MKAIALTLLLFLLPWSTAQAQQDSNYCQLLASFATAVAQDRDAGLSKEQLFLAISKAAVRMGETITTDMQDVIHYVYRYPHDSPRLEGNAVFEICVTEML